MTYKEERQKKIKKAMKKVYKDLFGLQNNEVICVLETVKLDYLLNEGLVVLDGKTGKVY